jgi:hypothetical protein
MMADFLVEFIFFLSISRPKGAVATPRARNTIERYFGSAPVSIVLAADKGLRADLEAGLRARGLFPHT